MFIGLLYQVSDYGYATIQVMAQPSVLYRNARSGELLELFLVAAVSTVLLVRFWLHLTKYPSLGGHSFHIAHLLFGGILLMASLVLMLNFIGHRVQQWASLIGGIGFGLFIDELGKFITRDNNYFFQPTIALIYLIFMLLFVGFRSLSRERRLTQPEYILNAIALTEEVVIEDLDAAERKLALDYLEKSGVDDALARGLRQALRAAAVEPTNTRWLRYRRRVERGYERWVSSRVGVTVIDVVFVIKSAGYLFFAGQDLVNLIARPGSTHLAFAVSMQAISSTVSALLVIGGVVQVRRSRLDAYNLFLKSLFIDLFITQFFSFYQHQFAALPGFILTIVLYVTLRFLRRQEQRLVGRQHAAKA
jgi:hypothetical protein